MQLVTNNEGYYLEQEQSQETEDSNTKNRRNQFGLSLKGILVGILVPLIFCVFWIAVFSFRTEDDPLLGLFGSISSIAGTYVFPSGMFLSIGYQKQKRKNLLLYLSVAFILGLSYVLITGYLIAYTLGFNSLNVFLFWILIPSAIILMFNRGCAYALSLIWNHITNSRWSSLFICIFILSMLLRFPLFYTAELGVDSFLYHILSVDLLATGRLDWVISPLSLVELWPPGGIASPVIVISGAAALGQFSVSTAILVNSVALGMVSSLAFPLFLIQAKKCGLFTDSAVWVSSLLYAFMPLLIKFTDWGVTGRSIFFYIAPFALILLIESIFSSRPSKLGHLGIWILSGLALFLSHGMGRILLMFGLGLVLTTRLLIPLRGWLASLSVLKPIPAEQYDSTTFIGRSKIVYNRLKILVYDIWPRQFESRKTKSFVNVLPVFAIVLFVFPYILHALGISSWVGYWMLNRTSITSVLGTGSLSRLIGFLFVYTARLGVASPIFLFGIATLPYWIRDETPNIPILLFGIIAFFPIFPNSMYFYQVLSIPMFLVVGLVTIEVARRLSPWFEKISLKGPININRDKWYRILIVCLVLLAFTSTQFIQYYRVSEESASISEDLIAMATDLEGMYGHLNVSYLSPNVAISERVLSILPNMHIFPMRLSVFYLIYNLEPDDLEYSADHLTPDIAGMINLFRVGLMTANIETLQIVNHVCERGTIEDFELIKDVLNVYFLIDDGSRNWRILNEMQNAGRAILWHTYGRYNVYLVDHDIGLSGGMP
jgi:hypothetical protein